MNFLLLGAVGFVQGLPGSPKNNGVVNISGSDVVLHLVVRLLRRHDVLVFPVPIARPGSSNEEKEIEG